MVQILHFKGSCCFMHDLLPKRDTTSTKVAAEMANS